MGYESHSGVLSRSSICQSYSRLVFQVYMHPFVSLYCESLHQFLSLFGTLRLRSISVFIFQARRY